MIDVSQTSSKVVLLLLLVSLLLTLYRAKQRLVGKSWRFIGVACLNVVASLVLAAWLTNLSFEHETQERVLLITDATAAVEQADFDGRYSLVADGPVEQISDPAMIRLAHPNLTELTVQGYGLHAGQWSAFAGVKINHQTGPVDAGLVDLRWPRQLMAGNSLTVSGRYQQAVNDNLIKTVQLLDPAGTVVSTARVRNNESFNLSAIPKAVGHFEYAVQLVDGQSEPVPVEIVTPPPAKLLVIQSAPSFESKHLKNWASEQGAALLLLTTISKDKTLSLSVNLPKGPSQELSLALLSDFDLLVMDGRALVNLSALQQQWLQQAVNQGLGLLVIADNALSKAEQRPALLSSFSLIPMPDALTGQPSVLPNWPTKRAKKQSELVFAYQPVTINASQGVVLVRAAKQVLSLYQPQGLGKVALSIVKDRYRWRLNGDMQTYSHYWQWMFSQLARTRSDSRFVAPSEDRLNLVNHRRQTCVISPLKTLSVFTTELGVESTLPLAIDRFNPYRQCIHDWPKKAGWQRFELQDSNANTVDVVHRFTFAPQQWQSWQQNQRLKATTEFIQAQAQIPRSNTSSLTYKPINPNWYWWLLMMCASFLWLERKLSD
ncbi:MAG: hypothetical protein ACI8WB_002174 [Phenylobacterium sp.]|jgi:hypothetical protein